MDRNIGRLLFGQEHKDAEYWMKEAVNEAKKYSTCLRRKCGAVVVMHLTGKINHIMGRGANSPPGDLESQRRCNADKRELHEKVTDPTCCIHAEDRAVRDALARNGPFKGLAEIRKFFRGSRIYYMGLNPSDNKIIYAGDPYCTGCSKLVLDAGISEFALWHEEGIRVYQTEDYNRLSFEFK